MMAQAKKSEAKRRGRKASGLRDLPPEAAALAVNAAALKAVRAALEIREDMRKQTGMAGGLPTLERLMRQDVAMTRILVPEEGEVGLKAVLRADSLEDQLVKAGFPKAAAWTAERFARDVEAMTIGKLTASYGEGLGGGTSAEPERMLRAMQRLHRASEGLTRKERMVAWAVLVFGLTMTDAGWAALGRQFGARREVLSNGAWLLLDSALERMSPVYLAMGE